MSPMLCPFSQGTFKIMIDPWLLVLIVVGSFIVTQLLLAWLQRLRVQRIQRKSLELCGEVAHSPTHANADSVAASSQRRVPLTLITGFLGSGKTTLVNRLVSGELSLRAVVIENELGSISIDHALIDQQRQEGMPDGVFVLKNGCMCCSGESPGSELERVLDKLLEMAQIEGGSLPFDCVLIETSGLADPAPIVQVLCRHEMTRSCYYLDAVITMVDANHILRHLRPYGPMAFTRRRPEAEKQLALADRIIVNKASATRRVQLSAACRSPLRSAPLPSHSFHHGPSGSFHPVPSRSIHLPSRSIPNTSPSIMFRPIPSHPLPFRPRPVPFHPVPFHPVPSHSVPFDPVPCHTMPIPYPCHTHTTPTPHPHHTILYHTIPCRRTPSCKVDLTDADVLADVTAAVRVVNGSAAILTATKASVPLGELLGLHAFSSDEFQKRLAPQVDADGITSGVGTHGAGVRPGVQPGLEAAAGDGVSCVCIRTTSDVELPKLEAWLQKLVQKKHEDIFRIKGASSGPESAAFRLTPREYSPRVSWSRRPRVGWFQSTPA